MHSNYQKAGLSLVLGLCLAASGITAPWGKTSKAPENLPQFNTNIQSVVLFKNGLGYFQREGKTSLNNNWAETEINFPAILGTLWFGSPDPGTVIQETLASTDTIKVTLPAQNIDEMLNANMGKEIGLVLDSNTCFGILQPMEETPATPPGAIVNRSYNPTGLVMMKLLQGGIAINPRSAIRSVLARESIETSLAKDSIVRKLKFKVDGKMGDARIGISYLQKNISWIPSYRIDINDTDKAQLFFKAMIVNDAEDLQDADVSFAVGYPNFRYADFVSPLAMDKALGQFLDSLNNYKGVMKSDYSGFMTQNYAGVALYDRQGGDSMYYGAQPGANLSITPEEDLYFYQLSDVTLGKNQRAEFPVFSAEVNYQHVYTWNVPDILNVDVYGYKQGGSQQQAPKNMVWHCLKMENTTDYPWTTAPALVVNGNKPISQEDLSYTPKQGKVYLKLTVASDIKTEQREEETDRQRNQQINDSRFDKVTIKGELYLKNYQNREAKMEIKKDLVGEILDSSTDAKVTRKVEGLRGINPVSHLDWEINLAPGEERTLSYQYVIYTR
jgi:hypothetical protein